MIDKKLNAKQRIAYEERLRSIEASQLSRSRDQSPARGQRTAFGATRSKQRYELGLEHADRNLKTSNFNRTSREHCGTVNDSLIFDSVYEPKPHQVYQPSNTVVTSRQGFKLVKPTKNLLKAGYIDPAWTAKIKHRNEKKRHKTPLTREQLELIKLNKSLTRKVQKGDYLAQDSIMKQTMSYGLTATLNEVAQVGLAECRQRHSPERSRSPNRSPLRKSAWLNDTSIEYETAKRSTENNGVKWFQSPRQSPKREPSPFSKVVRQSQVRDELLLD